MRDSHGAGETPAAEARAKYDRAARFYDIEVLPMELLMMRRFRRRVMAMVRGPHVLEVGVGTGVNLPDYPADVELDAIDLSPRMLERARRRRAPARLRLQEMDAERLAFPGERFDTVVSTCVFCSVPDPIQGFREIRRVLRPGGRALFLEHVRPAGRWLGALFDRLDPIVSRLGPHIDRRTVENMRLAGLTILSEENVIGSVLKLVVARA
jgi:ubiquinone/menaquinone biosynthesis C-methylase UbiE